MINFASVYTIYIIGGGAAGCFCAVEIKRRRPDFRVCICEAGPSPMAKLGLTGGGRCNITNSFENVENLKDVYPRGAQTMKRALSCFSWKDCAGWWEKAGLPLVTEAEGRMFPKSQRATDVVDKLRRKIENSGIELQCGIKTISIRHDDAAPSGPSDTESKPFTIDFEDGSTKKADAVVVATGGTSPGKPPLETLLHGMDLETEKTVPSLFTFKLDEASLKKMMGITVENVSLGIEGFKAKACGPMLITDWGVSGPSVLRLSSYAARQLAEQAYNGTLQVNWLGNNEEETRKKLSNTTTANPQKMLSGLPPEGIPGRLWKYLLERSGLRSDIRCAELGSKGLSRLCSLLCCDSYRITGRARFKEEFVSCGGVNTSEINPVTMESRKVPGLWVIGEALNIDAITGGFNLQAAWSTAFCAAKAIAEQACEK